MQSNYLLTNISNKMKKVIFALSLGLAVLLGSCCNSNSKGEQKCTKQETKCEQKCDGKHEHNCDGKHEHNCSGHNHASCEMKPEMKTIMEKLDKWAELNDEDKKAVIAEFKACMKQCKEEKASACESQKSECDKNKEACNDKKSECKSACENFDNLSLDEQKAMIEKMLQHCKEKHSACEGKNLSACRENKPEGQEAAHNHAGCGHDHSGCNGHKH